MVYRVALALGLLLLGAWLGRELAHPYAVTAGPHKPRRPLRHNLLNAPMDNVSVH